MTIPDSTDPRWRELAAALREPPQRSARVTRSARSAPPVDPAFAAAVKQQLRQRDRRIEALEADVAALRNELSTARRLDELVNRLDRLEASPRSGLRVA